MPLDPNSYLDNQMSEEEYRRKQAARTKRRKQRRNQRLLLIGAFVVAAVLVIVCFVLIIRSIFGGKAASSSVPSSQVSSVSQSVPQSGPGYSWPVGDATAWNLILINKNAPMPSGYNPDVVIVSDVGHTFHASAAEDLKAMIAACNADGSNSLQILSAQRGEKTQTDRRQDVVTSLISQGYSQAEAERTADQIEPAYPMSDHQTALGLKFRTNVVASAEQAFGSTPEFTWLMEHAHEYGFVLRFPEGKENITGILYQPYHWRYVGKEDAAVMKQYNICLEEYLAQMPDKQDDDPGNTSLPQSLPASVSGSGSQNE